MADVNANIGVHIDTSAAITQLKNLQRQLALFHQSVAKTSSASALAQKNLQTNLLNSINATGQFAASMGTVRTSAESFTHALESNKLSMREYFRYAGGASKTFGRLFKQEFDTIGRVAEERVKKMQTQYIKMGRDASGAMQAMAIRPTTLNMKDYGTQTAMAAQRQALFNQLLKQGSTNLLNFGKNTQWAGRQLMVGFTVPLVYFGGMASKVFMDLEAQALKFRRVYGDMFTTSDETNKALEDVRQLAEEFTKYGVAVAKTMEMAASAAAMGKTGADLTAQVAQATRLAVLGNVEQEQALETTISITNAFGVASEDLASKIDFLNSVENQTVVAIEDLTIAIPKAGPVVKQLGGDVEDLAFFLTAMKEGGINASEGANALKSGLASLINPAEKSAKFLAGLGININSIVESNAGDIKATVIDFANALDTLDPLNRARAIEQLFGKFQFSRLSTLFQNVTKDGTQASRVLQMATASVEELAILSERELKAVEDSVGVQFKEAMEQLKVAIAPIGEMFLKTITPVISVIGRLLEKFDGLEDGTKKFIVVATTLVGVIGPVFLMTFGLVANGVANIIKLFLSLRTGFLKLGGNSRILAEQTSYLNSEQLESATVAASLNQAHTRLTQSFTAETAAVKLLRQAYVDATVAAAAFARANPGMMMPRGRGGMPQKFARGATYVPGTGNKDNVPAVLTPGEAVIPRDVAQDPKFQPIIDAMVNGNLQAFNNGSGNVQPFAKSPQFQPKLDLSGPSSQVLNTNPGQVNNLVLGNPAFTESDEAFAARSAALLARMNNKKNAELTNRASSAVVAFGAHQPFTTGHEKVASTGKQIAEVNGVEFMQYTTEDGKSTRSVVSEANRIKQIEEVIGQKPNTAKDPFKLMKNLSEQGKTNISLLLGTDRMQDAIFDEAAAKYGINLEKIEVQRLDDDVSATKLRNAIVDGDMETANKLIASGTTQETKDLIFNEIKKNYKKPSTRMSGELQRSHVGTGQRGVPISDILLDEGISPTNQTKLKAYQKILQALNIDDRITTQSRLAYDFPKASNVAMRDRGIPATDFLNQWESLGPQKWKPSGITQFDAREIDQIVYDTILEESRPRIDADGNAIPGKMFVNDEDVRRIIEDDIPEKYPTVAKSKTHRKMMVLKGSLESFRVGVGLGKTVEQTEKALQKAVDAKAIRSFEVKPTVNNDVDKSGKLLTGSISVIDSDGNPVNLGRGEAGNRFTTLKDAVKEKLNEINREVRKNKDGTNAAGARSLADRENEMKKVASNTRKSLLKNKAPENYVKQIQATTGFSFTPAPQIGGLYEKADGTRVFVKPMYDYQSALAEQRGTIIARDVHGLESPEQTIKTMIDPTDIKGKRKLIVLESPFENRFNPANMENTFTENDHFKQLVAASLRADSDLKKGNLSGKIMADVGAAGVYDSASGSRTYSKNLPSMEEQARIILGLEKGGQSFFRDATPESVMNLSPEEYKARMLAEIEEVLPKLKRTVQEFGLSGEDAKVYQDMIDRLEAGKTAKWDELHSAVLVTRKESKQNKKTDKITKVKPEPGASKFKPSSGKLADEILTTLKPDEEIVQTPKPQKKTPRRIGRAILPGLSNSPEARTGIRIIDAQQQFKAEQNSLRRQLEKIEQRKIVETKKEIKQQQKQSETRAKLEKVEQENIKSKIKDQQDSKMQKQQSRMMKMQGVGMAAMMASSAGYMTGNNNLGHALMGISVLSMLGPMLKGPASIFTAALIAGGATIIKLNRDIENARKEGVELANSMSMTANKLQSLSELTGTVSATEEANRRRTGMLSGTTESQRQSGQNILESEFGKGIIADIETQSKSGSSIKEISQNLANNLAIAVAQGAVTTSQARSIAAALGEKLGSYEIPALVSGKLVSLLGPNGENLESDPLQITLQIQKDSMERQASVFKTALEASVTTSTLVNYGKVIGGGITAVAGTGMAVLGIPALLAGGIPGAGAIAGGTALAVGGAASVQSGLKGVEQKKVSVELSAAAVQLGVQEVAQNQGLVDSLNKQYDLKLKSAKTESEIQTIESNRKESLRQLNNSNKNALNLLISQKDQLGEEAFTKGIKNAADAMYKEGPMAVFKDQAITELGKFENSEFKTTLQIGLASGNLDPAVIIKLLSAANGDKGFETSFKVLVDKQGLADAGLIANLLPSEGATDSTRKLILDYINNNEEDFNKDLQALSMLNNINPTYGITLDLKANGVQQLRTATNALKQIESLPPTLTRTAVADLAEEKPGEWKAFYDQWETLSEGKDTVQTTLKVAFDIVSNDPNFEGFGAAAGKSAAEIVAKGDVLPNIFDKGNGNSNLPDPKPRDTTFDNILSDLKRTRDATIDAQGGAKELIRILSGKKDLKLFSGIDQQLSKLGANSDFINFVGGVEKAVQNKLIKVNKAGKISLTELGEATKKAYDEKQLGLFSSASAQAITELQKQRSGFVSLKAAGAGSAEALEMVADANFAVSLSSAKTSKEVKTLIKDFKNLKKEEKNTLLSNDPQAFLKTQTDIVEQKLDLDERIARRTYEKETDAAEKQIDLNNTLIDQAERDLEINKEYGDTKIKNINDEIEALQRRISLEVESEQDRLDSESRMLSEDQSIISNTVDAINKKYDEQEETLSKIYEINEEIAEQEKEKLGLADALTQGDITAAAQAAQDMRARSAARLGASAQEMLGRAREREVTGVRGLVSGKTADEIAARQYQIERLSFALTTQRLNIEKNIEIEQEKLYQIELKRKEVYEDIETLKENNYSQNEIIRLAQVELDKKLETIKVERDRLKDLELGMATAVQQGADFEKELANAYAILNDVTGLWNGLTDKNLKVTIQQIEERIKDSSTGLIAAQTAVAKIAPAIAAATGTAQAKIEADNQKKVLSLSEKDLETFNKVISSGLNTPSRELEEASNPIMIYPQIEEYRASGGLIPKYFAAGGFARGTDTIPAMLTPGEFVVRKNAVDNFGANNLNRINDGTYSGNSVYNYSINIGVNKSNASSDDIARSVIGQIKYIDSQRIKGQR